MFTKWRHIRVYDNNKHVRWKRHTTLQHEHLYVVDGAITFGWIVYFASVKVVSITRHEIKARPGRKGHAAYTPSAKYEWQIAQCDVNLLVFYYFVYAVVVKCFTIILFTYELWRCVTWGKPHTIAINMLLSSVVHVQICRSYWQEITSLQLKNRASREI